MYINIHYDYTQLYKIISNYCMYNHINHIYTEVLFIMWKHGIWMYREYGFALGVPASLYRALIKLWVESPPHKKTKSWTFLLMSQLKLWRISEDLQQSKYVSIWARTLTFQVKAHHAYLLDILEEHGVAKLNTTWHSIWSRYSVHALFLLLSIWGFFQRVSWIWFIKLGRQTSNFISGLWATQISLLGIGGSKWCQLLLANLPTIVKINLSTQLHPKYQRSWKSFWEEGKDKGHQSQ